MTGHDSGLITLNLAEADDVRARARHATHGRAVPHAARAFPPRDRPLLLGPADRAIRRASTEFRTDVRRRAAGLRPARCSSHYADGPPPDWPERFVTAYASSHPWEDFAETWAHYFHMVDTLETASAFGLKRRPEASPRARAAVGGDRFRSARCLDGPIVEAWLPLTFAMNSINRSMGLQDLYPFVLSPAVIVKISFVHLCIHSQEGRRGAEPPKRSALQGHRRRAPGRSARTRL